MEIPIKQDRMTFKGFKIILRPRVRKANGVRKFSSWKRACAVVLLCAATAAVSAAQPCTKGSPCFRDMANFVGANGMYPTYMALVQGADGNLYGTTKNGGADLYGTIFKIVPISTISTIYSFNNTDGANPEGGLVLGSDGNFYGTASAGGAHGKGTVFKITPGGVLTTLYSFDESHGNSPWGALVLGTDGNFYGTTSGGGDNGSGECSSGCGTIFKITPDGTLTSLHKFNFTDGAYPGPGLALGSDGNFYGTTSGGADSGTFFKITPEGTLTPLQSVGGNPVGPLVQGADGNFYGTTSFGGLSGLSACSGGCGTVFKMTPTGTLTTLHKFDFTNGAEPEGGLVLGTDGNFYGTTSGGGLGGGFGYGTVFSITPSGTLTTLHKFDFTDGSSPSGGLLQGTDGNFYGTTFEGGPSGSTPWGTVFSLGVGLGSFVTVQPGSGRPLTSVTVLGTDLTGATAVTFNGTPATFTVLSQYAIEATVPAFATSGTVQVTTPGGTLTSNVPFVVVCPFFSCPISLPIGPR